MNKLLRVGLGQARVANQRLAAAAGNGAEWMFRREGLVKSGRTWFELVLDGDPMSVRYYSLPDEDEIEMPDGSFMPIDRKQKKIPLVLVPPLGVTTETFDLMPQRSLVRYMVARGFQVYLVDWGKPRREHAGLGMHDYAHHMMSHALNAVRKHSGSEELSLMGWCMGGLLCLIYQGLNQDPNIRNLVTVASPIDMRGGGIVAGAAQALNGPAKLIRRYTRLRMQMLNPEWLHSPSWATTLAFKMTDPVGSVTTYWDLVSRLWDRKFVESHSTTADYLNNMLIYPGGVIQDMTVKFAVDNQMASGKLEIRDKIADLGKITANMLAFAGKTDKLVPPSIAQKIVDIIASEDKEFRVAPGGHMGVILGSKAANAVWAQSAEWLAVRSR
ncbi:MAG: alpha/beta fold hydrolase [Oceanococcus sp.]